jgi:hypothetical protein
MSEEAITEKPDASSPISFDKIVDERGVPLGNVLKEVTRKLGRINEVNAKLDMLLQNNVTTANQSPDEGTQEAAEGVDVKTKRYVDSRLEKFKQLDIEKAQNEALDQVFKTFPELNKTSDDFDQDFFNLAVEYENSLDKKDPARPMKAAKLAALDLGKIERIQKAKIIQDEARRTRMLTEGSAPSKEGSTKAAPKQQMNKAAIEKWFKIDASKVEKFVKEEK